MLFLFIKLANVDINVSVMLGLWMMNLSPYRSTSYFPYATQQPNQLNISDQRCSISLRVLICDKKATKMFI